MEDILADLYSLAAKSIRPSPIREMLHLVRKPGMISFAGGMPDPDIFPVEQFQQAASIISREGKDILQYGTTEGYPPSRNLSRNGPPPGWGGSFFRKNC